MNPETVSAMADQLRQYATHFAPRDWAYSRKNDICHIRMVGDWSGYDHPFRRVKRTIRRFLWTDQIERSVFGRRTPMTWRHPLIALRVGLSTDSHLPDGVLDGGAIVTHWEETGEYLQYVQPSVGALIADLMDAHPELPEVQAVAAEMKRINDDYGRRIAEESDE